MQFELKTLSPEAVSRAIAIRVACTARDCGVGRELHGPDVEAAIDAAMWRPDYVPYEPVRAGAY